MSVSENSERVQDLDCKKIWALGLEDLDGKLGL